MISRQRVEKLVSPSGSVQSARPAGCQPPSIRHHHGRKKRRLRRSVNSSSSRAAESRADIRSAVIRKRSAISCSAPSRSNAARNSAWRLAASTSSFAISVCNLSIWRLSAVAVVGYSSIAIALSDGSRCPLAIRCLSAFMQNYAVDQSRFLLKAKVFTAYPREGLIRKREGVHAEIDVEIRAHPNNS